MEQRATSGPSSSRSGKSHADLQLQSAALSATAALFPAATSSPDLPPAGFGLSRGTTLPAWMTAAAATVGPAALTERDAPSSARPDSSNPCRGAWSGGNRQTTGGFGLSRGTTLPAWMTAAAAAVGPAALTERDAPSSARPDSSNPCHGAWSGGNRQTTGGFGLSRGTTLPACMTAGAAAAAPGGLVPAAPLGSDALLAGFGSSFPRRSAWSWEAADTTPTKVERGVSAATSPPTPTSSRGEILPVAGQADNCSVPGQVSEVICSERGSRPSRAKRRREEEEEEPATARADSGGGASSNSQGVPAGQHLASIAGMVGKDADDVSEPPLKRARDVSYQKKIRDLYRGKFGGDLPRSTPPQGRLVTRGKSTFLITHHASPPAEGFKEDTKSKGWSFAVGKTSPAASANAGGGRCGGGAKNKHRNPQRSSRLLGKGGRAGAPAGLEASSPGFSGFSASSRISGGGGGERGAKRAAARPARPSFSSGAAAGSGGKPDGSVLVVIDGSNTAFGYREGGGRWLAEGPLLAIQYFEKRGMRSVAFIPCSRINHVNPGDEVYQDFMEARARGAISLVPPRGNDDLYFLKHAIDRNGFVVTNDRFRDHAANDETLAALGQTRQELKAYLSFYHVSYTFARDEFVPDPEAPLIKELTRQASDKRRERAREEDVAQGGGGGAEQGGGGGADDSAMEY